MERVLAALVEERKHVTDRTSVGLRDPRGRRRLVQPPAKPRGHVVRSHRLEGVRAPRQVHLVNDAVERRQHGHVVAGGAADGHGVT
jgi:hypothetical protein